VPLVAAMCPVDGCLTALGLLCKTGKRYSSTHMSAPTFDRNLVFAGPH